ncbi:MAG TPA: cytochrome c oxidase assembly protein [Caulobacteraceae bacterium]|nr:cytochrome c oxidase assembly protein [Caulobacteraceae bacterium]
MPSTTGSDPQRKAIRRTALICGAVFFCMVGAAFAAVPLYRIFCQQTGFDGASRRASARSDTVLAQTVTVRFDANVRDLPWDFGPDQVSQTLKIGATGLAFFHVTNHGDRPVTGHAVFNVAPQRAGLYFEKLQCFCFTDQTLKPGQTADFPVVYFVDPHFAADPDTRNTPQITLSYTFYPAPGSTPEAAPEPGAQNKTAAPIGGSPRAAL